MTTLKCKACDWSFILERQKFIAEIGSHSSACPKCGSLATIKLGDTLAYDIARLGDVQGPGYAPQCIECPVCKTLHGLGAICPKCNPTVSTKKVTHGPVPHDYSVLTTTTITRTTCATCWHGTPIVFKEQRIVDGEMKAKDVSMVRCRRFPRHETMPPEETCGEWKGKMP